MKRRSKWIIPMGVAGGLFLAVSPVLFRYPLFGWGIWGLITLLFAVGIRSTRRELLRLEREIADVERARSGESPRQGSEAALRSEWAARQKGGEASRTADFSEILSAKESSHGVSGLSGAVVMLGLIGTFYGLMAVIASAGPAVQQQSGSYDVGMVLQPIFSGMRGIFGTSLCGLVAALILNLARSLHQKTQLQFMAEIEEYTRFELLPSLEEEGVVSSGDLLLDELRQLNRKIEAFRTETVASIREAVAATAETAASVRDAAADLTGAIRESGAETVGAVRKGVDVTEKIAVAVREGTETAEKTSASLREAVAATAETVASVRGAAVDLTGAIRESGAGTVSAIRDVGDREVAELQGIRTVESALQNLTETVIRSSDRIAALSAEQSGEVAVRPVENVSEALADAVALMRANQVEFQAGLEMFSKGVEELLDGLQRDREDETAQADYFERLETALTSFSDRATESLVESSLHTQEILLEVLRQARTGTLSTPDGER